MLKSDTQEAQDELTV